METMFVEMRRRRNLLFVLIAIVLVVIICFSFRLSETSAFEPKKFKEKMPWFSLHDSRVSPHDILRSVLRPERFDNKLKVKKDWYKANCYGALDSLENLDFALQRWKKSQNEECKDMYTLFTDIYSLDFRQGYVVLNPKFSQKVLGWLNNKQELLEEAKNQTIFTISNRYTQESTVCNPLRAKRPGASGGKQREFVDKIISESKESCDFCKYKDFTAKDIFGSVESEYAASFSNTFKIEKYHGLIIMKHHSPIEFTLPEFLDLFAVAKRWFVKANEASMRYIYPHIYWDILPKASASQIHPHIHVCISSDGYYAKWNHLHAASLEFSQLHQGQNYFTVLTQVHNSLGLAVQYGNATAFPYLTPQGGREIVVLSRNMNDDFFVLFYFVMKAFIEDANLYAISAGMVFPSLGSEGVDGREMPAMARVLDRGPVDVQRSDISSIELFGTPNVNVDPFEVKKLIVDSIEKRKHEHQR